MVKINLHLISLLLKNRPHFLYYNSINALLRQATDLLKKLLDIFIGSHFSLVAVQSCLN